MDKLIFTIFRVRPVLILLTVICLMVGFHTDAPAYFSPQKVHPDAYSREELKGVIDQYQDQVETLRGQIRDIQKDADWLVLKMNRIADSGRTVPRQMKISVEKKEKKVADLSKERSRLKKLIAQYQKFYDAKYAKPEKSYGKQKIASKPIRPVAAPAKKRSQPVLNKSKREKIADAVKKAGLSDWIDVLPADNGCAKLENTLPILFSSGSASLAKAYKPFLQKLAVFLKSYDVKVYVDGYADPDPIKTSRYPSNFELGASRAANVVHELVRYGLKPSVFNIGTTGEYRFLAKKPSDQKSFQRRAQLTVVFSG